MHKKFGRKHVVASAGAGGGMGGGGGGLRTSKCAAEIYAVVVRLLGNGMFHCHCIDNCLRLGHVRGKFAGRGKRDNAVKTGTWVLMGLREWDSSAGAGSAAAGGSKKIQHCDLLEVYSDADKMRLMDTVAEPWARLRIGEENVTGSGGGRGGGGRGGGGGEGSVYDDDYLRFASDAEIKRDQLVQDMCAGVLGKTMTLAAVAAGGDGKGEEDDDMLDEGVFSIDDI